MNNSCVIALKLTDQIPSFSKVDWIGADKGALVLAEHGIHMTAAIGDFDSVEQKDFEIIQKHCDEMIKLNPIKDDSDSEAAVRLCDERGYHNMTILGALGGRIDHEIVNLRLAAEFPDRIVLLGTNNEVRALGKGVHQIEKENYTFISFFSFEQAVISLEGFKYPLDHRTLYPHDLYGLSNELTGRQGTVTVHEGSVLMVRSHD